MTTDTPVLDRLRLSAEDRVALRRQGSVCPKLRGRRVYYHLRFRSGGKRRSCYVGNDPATADQVVRELEIVQRDRRDHLQRARVCREAREILRATKAGLQPPLQQAGYEFHGYRMRKKKQILPSATPQRREIGAGECEELTCWTPHVFGGCVATPREDQQASS